MTDDRFALRIIVCRRPGLSIAHGAHETCSICEAKAETQTTTGGKP